MYLLVSCFEVMYSSFKSTLVRIIFENIFVIRVCVIKYFKRQNIKIPARLMVRKTKKGHEHRKEQNKEGLQEG